MRKAIICQIINKLAAYFILYVLYSTEQPETKAMPVEKCSYHKNTGQYRERQKKFTSIVK